MGKEKVFLSKYLKNYMQAIPMNIFFKDAECRYIYASEICEHLNKQGDDWTIIGKTELEVQRFPELAKAYYEDDLRILKTGRGSTFISEFPMEDKTYYYEIKKDAVRDDKGAIIGIVGVVNDVTELMSLKKKFESLTFYDNLTGLYNRNYFLKFDFNKSVCLPCTYMMCDCNDLKGVNDHLGHNTGDLYICETANILKEVLPEGGVCIRWGGDEFLLILPGCGEEKCQKIIAEINEQQTIKRRKMPYMEIAIGAHVRTTLKQTETEAIQLADQEMYADKKKRKVTVWK